MKLQYPGVANSIESDLDNLALLLSYTSLLPQQLYMDQAMKVRAMGDGGGGMLGFRVRVYGLHTQIHQSELQVCRSVS